jgi:hypothetical protein|tara:strand:- start:1342 stop:1536 length:195 start_codon:yes stop_codon:yes gene_type:complete
LTIEESPHLGKWWSSNKPLGRSAIGIVQIMIKEIIWNVFIIKVIRPAAYASRAIEAFAETALLR